ncbi:unnamed protein product [Ixodes pacificus]
MDNASYHSVQLEKLPSTSTRKPEIQSWLTKKKKHSVLKPELLQLVNQNKHKPWPWPRLLVMTLFDFLLTTVSSILVKWYGARSRGMLPQTTLRSFSLESKNC